MRHANALAEWDASILAHREQLLGVEQELRAVDAGQGALERKLALIETHQKARCAVVFVCAVCVCVAGGMRVRVVMRRPLRRKLALIEAPQKVRRHSSVRRLMLV